MITSLPSPLQLSSLPRMVQCHGGCHSVTWGCFHMPQAHRRRGAAAELPPRWQKERESVPALLLPLPGYVLLEF